MSVLLREHFTKLEEFLDGEGSEEMVDIPGTVLAQHKVNPFLYSSYSLNLVRKDLLYS